MEKIILSFSLVTLLAFSCQISAQDVKKETSEFSATAALKYLSSDELAGRDTGSEGIEKSAVFIEKAFKTFGLKPVFETYRDSFKLKQIDGYNVVGVLKSKESSDLKPLLIGAHFDHIGHIKAVDGDSIANGANDNASGTVAVLELAKFLSDKELKRDVIFALFSAEEKGLVGSRHLAKTMKDMNIEPYMVFNIEMLGVQMVGKDYRAYVTGYDMSNFADVFNRSYDEQFLGFLPQAKEYGLFKRSDNYPFYEVFKVPSHTICTFDFTNYEYYHHVNDEFEELDVKAFVQLVDDLKPGVLDLANSDKNAVKSN